MRAVGIAIAWPRRPLVCAGLTMVSPIAAFEPSVAGFRPPSASEGVPQRPLGRLLLKPALNRGLDEPDPGFGHVAEDRLGEAELRWDGLHRMVG